MSFFLVKPMITFIPLMIFGATEELNRAVWGKNAILANVETFRHSLILSQ